MKLGIKKIVENAERIIIINQRLKVKPPDVMVKIMNFEGRRRIERNPKLKNYWRRRIKELAEKEEL